MVTKSNGDMESGMFKHVYVDGTVRASNLEIIGDFVTLNTVTSNTEQVVVINNGTGPALKVTQTGINSIAEFYDDDATLTFKVANGGNIGIGTHNPLAKLDVSGSVIATSIQIGSVTNAHVPRGLISMWSGSIATIPTGWAICDGTNTTPDLRNRFVIGAGSTYAVAATGGATTVTLVVGNLPAHSHTGTTAASGSHNHTGTSDAGGIHNHSASSGNAGSHAHGSGGYRSGICAGGGSDVGWNGAFYPSNTGGVGDHSHSVSVANSVSHTHTFTTSTITTHTHTFTTDNTGSGTAFGILPPYYALAYIMKL